MTWIIFAGLIVAASVSQGSEVRKRFIGVWNLVSVDSKAKDGTMTKPYGDRPAGRITYDDAGRMSAILMRPGRREAETGFNAYYGTFDVDESARTVIHHVQVSFNPNWVGTDLRRTYEFEGNRLILTAVTEAAVMRIVWERDERR